MTHPDPGIRPAAHPLVIAHRGASGHRPEHSRSAYELAIELGADAVEPDLVVSRDGVLVVRHENEISGTTDVAEHPEFADRRTSKVIDGERLEGWFTEDLDWAELATLRCRERLPELRPESAAHDGEEPILRLVDLLEILEAAPRPIGLVAEVKHAAYFAGIGRALDEPLVDALAGFAGELWVESFEQPVLGRLRERGLAARYVFLVEHPEQVADAELDRLAAEVDGVSPFAGLLLDDPGIVTRAQSRGLAVFTWTLRPENAFLPPAFRVGEDDAAWGDWERGFGAIIRTGVDGIFCDHPELGVRARHVDLGEAAAT